MKPLDDQLASLDDGYDDHRPPEYGTASTRRLGRTDCRTRVVVANVGTGTCGLLPEKLGENCVCVRGVLLIRQLVVRFILLALVTSNKVIVVRRPLRIHHELSVERLLGVGLGNLTSPFPARATSIRFA